MRGIITRHLDPTFPIVELASRRDRKEKAPFEPYLLTHV